LRGLATARRVEAIRMKTKRTWTAPTLKDIPIFFEVSLYSGTR
jgi:hypothetical protein